MAMEDIERDQIRASIEHMRAQNERMAAEAAKFRAETQKTYRETFRYPIVVGAGLVGAGAAFAKLFL